MKLRLSVPLLLAAVALPGAPSLSAQGARPGTIVTERLVSRRLEGTRTGLDTDRGVTVYLPPGYASSTRSYPVIYYFHSLFSSPAKLFEDGSVKRILDRGVAEGVIREFILVAADYSSPTVGSFYENSSTSGRWMDFTVDELVPFVDRKFRTIRHRDSRGLAGDMIGAYGAFRFAMIHPDRFGSVYGLHLVGTGTGLVPMNGRPDWKKIHAARSFEDLRGDSFSQVFTAMAQAFSPNPARLPFHADFMVELENGELRPNIANSRKLQSNFLLDHLLPQYADNLRRMRGIKFDWGRYDDNQDHVYANQVFTRRLEELGIEHAAEEYRGNSWNRNWTPDGRVYGDMLPFFDQHLVFAPEAVSRRAP